MLLFPFISFTLKVIMFDPKVTKYPYPEYTDEHYLKIKKDNGLVLDKDYPYLDKSKGFVFKQKLVRILLETIVFPLTYIKLGLKVVGKKKLKEYKSLFKNGVVSISNHVHLFDYLAIMAVIRPIRPNVLVWAKNVRGENATNVRMVGGIPIPEDDFSATVAYMDTVDELLNSGGWLQIYPEGSMWEYYAPIRPFKKGAAYFASKNNKPVLPMAFSYRKASWIRRKIFHQPAVFTLTIGDPLFADCSLKKHEREIDLTKRMHDAVCELAHIAPEDNIYPPIFSKTHKINYY